MRRCPNCRRQVDTEDRMCEFCETELRATRDSPRTAHPRREQHPRATRRQPPDGEPRASGDGSNRPRTRQAVPERSREHSSPRAQRRRDESTRGTAGAVDNEGHRGQQPHRQPAGNRQTSTSRGLHFGQFLVLAGVCVTVVAVFLPWVNAEVVATGLDVPVSVSGINGDGRIALVCALGSGVVSIAQWRWWSNLLTILLGLSIVGIAVYYILEPGAGVEQEGTYDAAAGLYVTVLGGGIICVGALSGLLK